MASTKDFDPYELHIDERDDIEEGLRYQGADIRRLLWYAEHGDRLKIEPMPKSYSAVKVRVTGSEFGDIEAATDDGDEFYLIPEHRVGKHGNIGGGNPWMRTKPDYESRGQIDAITVLAKREAEEHE